MSTPQACGPAATKPCHTLEDMCGRGTRPLQARTLLPPRGRLWGTPGLIVVCLQPTLIAIERLPPWKVQLSSHHMCFTQTAHSHRMCSVCVCVCGDQKTNPAWQIVLSGMHTGKLLCPSHWPAQPGRLLANALLCSGGTQPKGVALECTCPALLAVKAKVVVRQYCDLNACSLTAIRLAVFISCLQGASKSHNSAL